MRNSITSISSTGRAAASARRSSTVPPINGTQIAGVPARHEPDQGELQVDYLLGVIDEVAATCGFDGWVGCEYRPAIAGPGGTSQGLSWARRWGVVPRGAD